MQRLLSLIGLHLGLDGPEGPVMQRQAFLSPAGLPCRLVDDPEAGDSEAALRVAVDLPLSTVELQTPHVAHLLRLQAVLAAAAGWFVHACPESGQLQLLSSRPVREAEAAVAELEAGSWLALSVLQQLTAAVPAPGAPSTDPVRG